MKKAEVLIKKGYIVVPTSAECELALSNAAKNNLFDYKPGSNQILKF
jgi:hypothetical protein